MPAAQRLGARSVQEGVGRYWLQTLGCPKNQVDSDKLEGYLEADRATPGAADPAAADLVVVNTCAFIDAARQESIDTVLDLADRRRAGARLVVTGCMAERYGDELRDALPEVDLVAGFGSELAAPAAGPRGRRRAGQPCARRPCGRAAGADRGSTSSSSPDPRPAPRGPTSRSPRGATALCGFCAIPSFRGKQRSRPPEDILAEVDALGATPGRRAERSRGAARGRPRGPGPRLLRAGPHRGRAAPGRIAHGTLAHRRPDPRRRGPRRAHPAALPLPVGPHRRARSRPCSPRACPTSTSPSSTCRARCSPACAAGATATASCGASATIRAADPDATFRSSFILGYPGETERDHDLLLEFLEAAQLDWAGFFPFSNEEGTHAGGLADQVPPELALERLRECSRAPGRHHRRRSATISWASAAPVLVDAPGRGRTVHEAPEIDGIVHVPAEPRGGQPRRRASSPARRGPTCPPCRPPMTSTRVRRRRDRGLLGDAVSGADARRPTPRQPGFTFGPSALVTPANAVTVARLLAAPVYVLMLVAWGASWVNVVVGFFLAASDGLDGYMARRHGTTRSGAFLDPLADKAVVLGALITLAAQGHLPWLPVVLITAREVGMQVYRSWVGPPRRLHPCAPDRPSSRRSCRTWPSVSASSRPWPTSTTCRSPWSGSPAALTLYTGAEYLLDGRRALHVPTAA